MQMVESHMKKTESLPNGVKCNAKRNLLSVLRLVHGGLLNGQGLHNNQGTQYRFTIIIKGTAKLVKWEIKILTIYKIPFLKIMLLS